MSKLIVEHKYDTPYGEVSEFHIVDWRVKFIETELGIVMAEEGIAETNGDVSFCTGKVIVRNYAGHVFREFDSKEGATKNKITGSDYQSILDYRKNNNGHNLLEGGYTDDNVHSKYSFNLDSKRTVKRMNIDLRNLVGDNYLHTQVDIFAEVISPIPNTIVVPVELALLSRSYCILKKSYDQPAAHHVDYHHYHVLTELRNIHGTLDSKENFHPWPLSKETDVEFKLVPGEVFLEATKGHVLFVVDDACEKILQ